jgi:beta-glucosidase
MTELVFPAGFMWGTATAAHQVEGNNSNCDWWDWELRPGSPCREPSGNAIEHYERYPADVALLARLGFDTYRFSVEWARIEPEEGRFDERQLDHYRKMVAAVRKARLTPMVTLNHFTLPRWVAAQGSWISDRTPILFERYVRRVVEALGDQVDWYCTINEPGILAFAGYMGGQPWPPGLHGMANFVGAQQRLIVAHRLALAAIKALRPGARVGMTHAMLEWESSPGARRSMEFARKMSEDDYLAACKDDDFVGVQTYTRVRLELPRPAGWVMAAALAFEPIRNRVVERMVGMMPTAPEPTAPEPPAAGENAGADDGPKRAHGGAGMRVTQMGYEYRPEAVAATVRRAASLLPGKPIVVTENGIATADDGERIEFITRALSGLHAAIADGIPLRGYVYWSGFDNFEWDLGYGMTFGLVSVNRQTQVRTAKPSAKFLGRVARSNKLVLPG